jgi:hypothetical protein
MVVVEANRSAENICGLAPEKIKEGNKDDRAKK